MMKKEEKVRKMKTGYYLVSVLRAVLKSETPAKIPKDITEEALFQMAKRHNVDFIAYEGLKDFLKEDSEIYARWKQKSMKCAMQGVVQLAERDRLYKRFAQAGIRILPLKGCLLKEMYPRQEFRQMSDLDILIDEENAVKAKALMEEEGYKLHGNFGHTNHDAYEKKPWCSVELHTQLLHKHAKNADKYKDIWKRAYEKAAGSGIWYLTWDDFYIYMLEHFAKHLYSSGSGIRFVMDIYVFLQVKGKELDQKYLKKQLKELELWEFKNLVEQLAKNWFEDGITGAFEETEELLIISGIYGTRQQHYTVKIGKLQEKYRYRWLACVVYVGKDIFLSYERMCLLYPFLKKYAVLLPFCWIHRILRIFVKNGDKIKDLFGFMGKMEKQHKSEQ